MKNTKATHKIIICKKCNKPFMVFKIVTENKTKILKVCPYCRDNNK